MDEEQLRWRMEASDMGGRDFAGMIILAFLTAMGGANVKLLSDLTGLPKEMMTQLLYELEDKNYVKVSITGKVWHVNEEMLH